jgi:predicted TIM-barrel fold metal-dependent hydrolase
MTTGLGHVVDTHFHLWDLEENYYPWLTDKVQTRVIGEYAAIRRNYLVADFLADAASSGVTKGVHIQAEHDPADPVRETRWLQHVADTPASQGFPHGIVAFADMAASNAAEVIEAHCEYRNVRGVRQLLMQHRIDPTAADPLSSRLFRHNMRLLQRYGLSFDLQLLPTDMHFGATIAADNSDANHRCIPGHMAFRDESAGCLPERLGQDLRLRIHGSPVDNSLDSASHTGSH